MSNQETTPETLTTYEEYRQRFFPSSVEREASEHEDARAFGMRMAHETLSAFPSHT